MTGSSKATPGTLRGVEGRPSTSPGRNGGLNRRELLLGGSMLLCGACATMPGRSERLPGGSTERANDATPAEMAPAV